jgi:hypothetical protein
MSSVTFVAEVPQIMELFCDTLKAKRNTFCSNIMSNNKSLFGGVSIIRKFNPLFLLEQVKHIYNRLCGLVVKVPGCRSKGPDSIPGATRFSEEKWVRTAS